MDDGKFDRLARALVGLTTRRGTLAGLFSGALVSLLADGDTEAKGKRRKKKKRKPCRGGTTRCGKRCVDTRVDPANCGGCSRTCTAPATCGGGNPGTPGVCGCTKATCLPGQCDDPVDGCGGRLACGGCESPNICGGGGTANVCGCLVGGTVTVPANRLACCGKSCCRDELPVGQCRCAGGCG